MEVSHTTLRKMFAARKGGGGAPPPTPTVCAWNVEYKSSQVTIKYVLLLVLKVPMSELPVNNEGK